MPRKKDKIVISGIVAVLIIIFAFILSIIIFQVGKSQGYSERNQELASEQANIINQRTLLSNLENTLNSREQKINNTENEIKTCFSNLQNTTTNLTECNKKVAEPKYYSILWFDMNYTYDEIKNILLSICIIFPITITLTLFKINIKDKEIITIINWLAFVGILILVLYSGLN